LNYKLSAFADEAGPSCEEQIAALQQAGLKFIDIRSMDGFNIVELPVEHARGVRAKLDAAGITVAMFGSPIGKIDIADDIETDLQRLRHLGELAPVLGCNAVRIFSYFNKAELPHDEWQVASLDRLRQLRDLAKELGLVLYHENESHIFGDKCDDVLVISNELRDDTFRMIFDFGNYIANGEDVWQNWLRLRDTTDGIHFKEKNLENQHVPVGQGAGYVPEIIRDAVARGWSGPMTVEPHLKHSPAVAATGPTGLPNQQLAEMSDVDVFIVACRAATDILQEAGAQPA